MTDMKKILILPLLLFFLVQGSMAQTPKWVEKAKRAVFSIVTYDKNDKMLNTGHEHSFGQLTVFNLL
mgnify:CR=1 FL=1